MSKSTIVGLSVMLVFLLGLGAYVAASGVEEAVVPPTVAALDTPGVVPPAIVDVYDPVQSGDDVPPGIRQLLPRDAIAPVYKPEFVSAAEVDWDDDTLIVGLALEGEARAYPVSFLNRREMVLDQLGSSPVLVTW